MELIIIIIIIINIIFLTNRSDVGQMLSGEYLFILHDGSDMVRSRYVLGTKERLEPFAGLSFGQIHTKKSGSGSSTYTHIHTYTYIHTYIQMGRDKTDIQNKAFTKSTTLH